MLKTLFTICHFGIKQSRTLSIGRTKNKNRNFTQGRREYILYLHYFKAKQRTSVMDRS